MLSTKRSQLQNLGLLVLRVGLGFMFILHGYPKVFGGPEKWTEVGSSMQYLGIEAAPMFFGFMAGIVEFFGGIFLMLGLFFIPTLVLLFIVMFVASITSIGAGEDFSSYSHSIEIAIVILSLFFIGSGRHSLDQKLNKRRQRRY